MKQGNKGVVALGTMRRGKKLVGALATVMAVLLTAALFSFTPKMQLASAARGDAWVTIDEIYNDKDHHFEATELKKLYQALGGNDIKTIDSLFDKVESNSRVLTSADFREVNDGNNISVWFGGIKWDAVYLTRATSGKGDVQNYDLILDLWRSSDTITSTDSSMYAADWYDQTTRSYDYLSNMYSTSLIRVKALNAGGKYSTSTTTLSEQQNQDRNNQYARFTMDGNDGNEKDSLKKYIARPCDIGYQEKEYDSGTMKSLYGSGKTIYYLPNDAYGTPDGDADSAQWYKEGTDYIDMSVYSSKGAYDDWDHDYLWLPSLTEVGREDGDGNGLWDTDSALRSINSAYTEGKCWLRSGKYNRAHFSYFCNSTGQDGSALMTWKYGVRPALHFNLSAAARASAIGEIYKGDGEFNDDKMSALYEFLTDSASFSTVEAAASENKTSRDFRSVNGANVSVIFGGIKWNAVYLTTAKNTAGNTTAGDVILDLWRAADTLTADKDRSTFSGGWTATETSNDYPSNMYSTSKVRVEALNAGGQYSTSGTELSASQAPSPSNQYARFTMDDATDSLTKWLAKPSEVGYQENEYDDVFAQAFAEEERYDDKYYLPNDAYGTPVEGGKWNNTTTLNMDYRTKGSGVTAYGAWKDDYLWLPSATEIGLGSRTPNGIWKTDASLRSARNGNDCWLRSGYYFNAGRVYVIDGGGSELQDWAASDSNYVRPALHLNLTKINGTITETIDAEWDEETFYTSGEDLFDTIRGSIWAADFTKDGTGVELEAEDDYTVYQKDDRGHTKQILDAGSYTFVIELLNTRYQFEGGAKTKEITVTVKDAVARVEHNLKDTKYVQGFESFNAAWEFSRSIFSKASTIILNQADLNAEQILVGNINFTSQDLTIDLNGYHLQFQSGDEISFHEGSTLTLTDSSGKDTGKLSGIVNVDNNGVFTMKGGTLNGRVEISEYGDGGTFTLEKGSIEGNNRSYPAVSVTSGNFTMKNGSITNPVSGGVYIYSGGTFTMEGGSISDCESNGVYVYSSGNFTMSGGSVTESKSVPDVCVGTRGTFKWSGGDIGRVKLYEGTHIDVPETFTKPSTPITIELEGGGYLDEDILVLQWADTDPTAWFKSTSSLCFYTGKDEKKAYIGFHSLVWDGVAEWTPDFTSVTFKNISCEHCTQVSNVNATLTGGITSDTTAEPTCTKTGTKQYTANVRENGLHDLAFDKEVTINATNSKINAPGGTFTATTTEILSAKGHAWEYSASGAELTATCTNSWHVEGAEKDGDKTFTVTVVAPTVSTYTGTTHIATVSGSTTAEPFIDYTLTYGFSKTDLSYADMGPGELPKAAGNYEARIAAKDSPIQATAAFVIGKATLTVTAKPYEITYGEAPANDGVAFDGFVNGEKVDVLAGAVEYAYSYRQFDDIGESYTITPSGYSSDNYDIHYAAGTLRVKARSVTATVTLPDSLVYHNVGEFSVEVEGLVNNDPVTAVLIFSGTANDASILTNSPDAPTLAGSYTVKAISLAGDKAGNYTLTEGDAVAFTIKRASIEIRWSGSEVNFTYTYGSTGTPSATIASGNFDEGNLTVSIREKDGKTFMNAGEYSYTATLGGSAAENYTIRTGDETKTYTITQKQITTDITWSDAESHTYDGKEHTPAATADGVNGELKLVVEIADGKIVKNADTYSFTASLSDDDAVNYVFENVVLTKEITISKKQVEIDWKGGSYIYTGAVMTVLPTATFDGVGSDGNGLSLAVSPDFEGDFLKAGSYQFKAALQGDHAQNYELKNPTETFEIERAAITVSGTYTAERAYDGTIFSATVTETASGLTVTMTPYDENFAISIQTSAADAATYEGKITEGDVKYDKDNYALTIETGAGYSIEISQKVLFASTIEWGMLTFGYDRLAHAPTAEIAGVNEKIGLKIDVSGELTDGAAIDAKTYTAKASLPAEAKNYTLSVENLNDTKTFTITRAVVTLTWTGGDVSYSYVYGSTETPSATIASGNLDEGNLNVSIREDDGKTFMNADSYTYTATLGGTAAKNYTIEKGDETQTYTITKRPITTAITWTDAENHDYDGKEHTPTATAEGVNGKLKLVVVIADGKIVKNAGTYSFTASLSADDAVNYVFDEDVDLTKEITISQKQIVVEWTGEDHVYDGSVFAEPTALARTGIGEEDFTLVVTMTDPLGGTFQAMGLYTFKAAFAADDAVRAANYSLLNAEKSYSVSATTDNDWTTELSLDGWTYDAGTGTHAPQAAAKYGSVEFTYSASQYGVYSSVQPVNAGTYWVKAVVGGTADYNGIEARMEFTISPKRVAVNWSGFQTSYTFTGASLGGIGTDITASFVGEGNDGTIGLDIIFSHPFWGWSEFKVAGDYSFTAAFPSNAGVTATNYVLTGETREITVEKMSISVDWEERSYPYQGKAYEAADYPTATVNRERATLLVSLNGSAPMRDVRAEGYTFTAALSEEDAHNYILTDNTKTYYITKAKLTVNWSGEAEGYAYVYTGKALPTPTATATGLGEDGEIAFAVALTSEGAIHVGKYAYAASFPGERSDLAGNYELELATREYEITKAANGWTLAPSLNGLDWGNMTWTYDGAAHAATATPKFGADGVKFTYSTAREGVYDDAQPTDAGDYFVKVSVAGNDDYEGLEEIGAFRIAKRTISSVTWVGEEEDYTYKGTKFTELTATAAGADADGTIALDVAMTAAADGDGTFANAGEYTFTATLPEKYRANYSFEATNSQKTVTIGKRTVSVQWGEERYTYTGTALALPTATAEGVGGDGTLVLIVTLDGTTAFRNAGDYLFGAALGEKDAENYILEAGTATCSYTVAKQVITAPTMGSKVYSGAQQTADVGNTALYTVTENGGGTDAGEYDVKLTLSDSANYKWADSDAAELTLTFTIEKAVYDMTGVKFEDLTIVYDAEEHSLFVTGKLPDGVSVRYEGNQRKTTGEYTVTAIFSGDEKNHERIPSMTAKLIISEVSHDLSGIAFEDVSVKYDGNAQSIFIDGTLPANVTVTYEGNGKIEPDIYTVTAVFGDPDGEFARKTAKLTILRIQTQTQPEIGPNNDPEEGPGEEERGADVSFISEEGFDPTLDLVVEKVQNVVRKYVPWERDEVSEKYIVKMCKDGVEVPIDGKVTVRLRIPEQFREKDFELMAVARGLSIEYTRDGDYVVFEAEGLSAYVFTCTYVSYIPIIIIASCVLCADILIMIVLAFVLKKKRNTTEE